MKGLNTKARYQVKLMLAVAALALFYESPGWSMLLSGGGATYMIIKKAKLESIKNLWWLTLSCVTFVSSLILAVSHYIQLGLGYELISAEKCHLFQQCLASILVGSIISSALSEKEITDAFLASSSSKPIKNVVKDATTPKKEEEEKKKKGPPSEAFDSLKDNSTSSSKESKEDVVDTPPEAEEEDCDYDIPTDYEPQIISGVGSGVVDDDVDDDEQTPIITNKVDGGGGEGNIYDDDIVTSTTSLSSEGQ